MKIIEIREFPKENVNEIIYRFDPPEYNEDGSFKNHALRVNAQIEPEKIKRVLLKLEADYKQKIEDEKKPGKSFSEKMKEIM